MHNILKFSASMTGLVFSNFGKLMGVDVVDGC